MFVKEQSYNNLSDLILKREASTLTALSLVFFFFASGKWCPRREWSSPPDAQRAASDARRGVLYSSVFLGSPGKSYELSLSLSLSLFSLLFQKLFTLL